MLAIALDCSTEILSVALIKDKIVLDYYQQAVGNRHSDLLLEKIDALLTKSNHNRAQIERIYVGLGPGSFTGIRVALGVARGLSMALQIEPLGISSLYLLAAGVNNSASRIHVLVDARMQRCYSAHFVLTDGVLSQEGDISEVEPEAVVLADDTICAGNGWRIYKDRLGSLPNEQPLVDAAVDVRAFLSIEEAQLLKGAEALRPIYVRNDVATPKKA